MKNKGFIPNLSGALEHTSLMTYIINRARYRERPLVITLPDLKNAFGEVHHTFIHEVLRYHHVPNHIHIQQLISDLYTDFWTFIITRDFNTSVLPVRRRVLQGYCLSLLIFNMCFKTFIQYINAENFVYLDIHIIMILVSYLDFTFGPIC